MAIGGITGIGQIGNIGKINTPTKKKEQYQSTVPMQSTVPVKKKVTLPSNVGTNFTGNLDNLKSVAAKVDIKNQQTAKSKAQDIAIKQSADATAISDITKPQNKSYIIKPSNPDKEFSWLEKDEADGLRERVNNSGLNGLEKEALKQETYKMYMEAKQAHAFLNERESLRNKMVAGEIKGDKDTMVKTYKTSTAADIIRKQALSEGYSKVTDTNDDDILTNFIQQKPESVPTFQKYINGDIGEVQMVKELGLGNQEDTGDKSLLDKVYENESLRNIMAGSMASATSIPRFVANNLYKGAGWLAKQLGVDENKVDAVVSGLQQGISEEQLAKEYGASQDSILYKGAKFLGDAVQTAAGGAMIEKAGASLLTKAAPIIGGTSKLAKAGQFAGEVIKGTATGLGSTELGTITSEGRLATKGELQLGGALGAAGGVISGVSKLKKGGKIAKMLSEQENKANKGIAFDEQLRIAKLTDKVDKLKKAGKLEDAIKLQADIDKMGGLKQQKKGIIAKLFGGRDVVNPSKKTTEAYNTVMKEIPNPPTDPIKLGEKIAVRHQNISEALEAKLSKINIDTTSKKIGKRMVKKINTEMPKIKESLIKLAEEIKGVSPQEANNVKKLIGNIEKAKTGSELWKARQDIDVMIPENIKSGKDLSDKGAYIYKNWKGARDTVNNFLDNINPGTKVEFKKLSDLAHANDQLRTNIDMLTKNERGLIPRLIGGFGEAIKYTAGGVVGSKLIKNTTGQ